MAFKYKMSLEIVTRTRINGVDQWRDHLNEEFKRGTKYVDEQGNDGEILDAKIEVEEEIL